jgi:hypothetical protein
MEHVVVLVRFLEPMTRIPVQKFGPLRIKMDAAIVLITLFKKLFE